jgi:predicted nucleotidyltransferase component of viral defense system
LEVLNSFQKEILKLMENMEGMENFYFTGGSALAYFYLKHRKSNDLDFFTSEENVIVPFSYHLEKKLTERGYKVERKRHFFSFVEVFISKEENFTLLHLGCDSPYRLEKLRKFDEFPKLKVDSLEDISANKLLSLFGRATLRDFIDVYFLINKNYFSPNDLIEKAKIKDPGFDIYWLGVALERINLFKREDVDWLLLIEKIEFDNMVDFFNQWRIEIAEELKGG